MGEKTRFFEIRTGEGQVIIGFSLVEKGVALENKSVNPSSLDQGGNEGNGGKESTNPGNNDSPMTEAQRRYLFRLLAEHGFQGENAHQELRNAFRVNTLTEVGKLEASKMIERLLGEGKGGPKNGPPLQ